MGHTTMLTLTKMMITMTTMILLRGASVGDGGFLQYAWLAIPDAASMYPEAHDVLPS